MKLDFRPNKIKVIIFLFLVLVLLIPPKIIGFLYKPMDPNCIPFYDKSGRCAELKKEFGMKNENYRNIRNSFGFATSPLTVPPSFLALFFAIIFLVTTSPVLIGLGGVASFIFALYLYISYYLLQLAYLYFLASLTETFLFRKRNTYKDWHSN